jgi:hypothetical protein
MCISDYAELLFFKMRGFSVCDSGRQGQPFAFTRAVSNHSQIIHTKKDAKMEANQLKARLGKWKCHRGGESCESLEDQVAYAGIILADFLRSITDLQ